MKEANETKQRLLRITRMMIDCDGVDAVSMRDLGKKANLSRTAVYRHFTSKEELLSAIVVESFALLKVRIALLIEEIDESDSLIKAILYAYYDYGIHNREQYNLMFSREWDKERYPEVHTIAFEIFCMIMDSIGKGQEQGKIVVTPVKELMAMVFAYIHGLVQVNLSGHYEQEKGLDNPYKLIDLFYSMIQLKE